MQEEYDKVEISIAELDNELLYAEQRERDRKREAAFFEEQDDLVEGCGACLR